MADAGNGPGRTGGDGRRDRHGSWDNAVPHGLAARHAQREISVVDCDTDGRTEHSVAGRASSEPGASIDSVAEVAVRLERELAKAIVGQHACGARDPDCLSRRRPLPAARRAGPRQDAADQEARGGRPPEVQPHSVHARPDAVRHPRHRGDRGRPVDRQAGDSLHPRPDLREHHPRRRDQPHAAQDPGRAARGDAGIPGHGRRRPLRRSTVRCSCSPRRIRSSRKAPIRCPKRSSIASCSTS